MLSNTNHNQEDSSIQEFCDSFFQDEFIERTKKDLSLPNIFELTPIPFNATVASSSSSPSSTSRHPLPTPSSNFTAAPPLKKMDKKDIPSRKVNHSYKDYGAYTRHSVSKMGSKVLMNKSGKRLFPSKLMEMLDCESSFHDQAIICWCPHGRAFKVRDTSVFEQVILPRHFKTNQMRSFRKQLSLWGFKRITKGVDAGSYYHQCFLRGMPHLLSMMTYQKIKGIGKASLPNPSEEPNFYLYPLLNTSRPLDYAGDRCLTSSSQLFSSYAYNNEVTDDENEEVVDHQEYLNVLREMSFPGPFTAPPCIQQLI